MKLWKVMYDKNRLSLGVKTWLWNSRVTQNNEYKEATEKTTQQSQEK